MNIKHKIITVGACLVFAGATLIGCGGSNDEGDSTDSNSGNSTTTPETQTPTTPEAPTELTFDTPFEFDDLTITIGSEMTTTVLENQFSDHNGKTVIAIPVTIVNNKDTTHGLNMYYHKTFGPAGTELPTVSTYFTDSDIDFAGDVRAGGTQNSFIHVIYEGDGDYFMEFATLMGDPVEVRLPIALA